VGREDTDTAPPPQEKKEEQAAREHFLRLVTADLAAGSWHSLQYQRTNFLAGNKYFWEGKGVSWQAFL
jgi:hypothetical protein